jgi:glutamyl-Q tRNA(Asp) synthetase
LGHAFAALFAHQAAASTGGRFLLRIEDIDSFRRRAVFETAIEDDLRWLGLDWNGPVLRQSERGEAYGAALDHLGGLDLLYPCFCTRAEIRAEVADSAHAHDGPLGPLYPGTCRGISADEGQARIAAGEPHALRLAMDRAVQLAQDRAGGPLTWHDRDAGTIVARPEDLGDVVLARKELATSYHLAVTVDDAFQGVTLVTRAADLFPATHVHRLLQALLGLPVPDYHHHQLLTGADGEPLTTRDGAKALGALREAGWTPDDVRRAMPALSHPEPVEAQGGGNAPVTKRTR